jgi:Fis family transcriptional regulator
VKDQLEALIRQMYSSNILYSEAVREFKKRFIITVLEENRGNQCKAARQLGMHRNTLSRTMQELKIDVRPLRAGARRPPRSARPDSIGAETGSIAQLQVLGLRSQENNRFVA